MRSLSSPWCRRRTITRCQRRTRREAAKSKRVLYILFKLNDSAKDRSSSVFIVYSLDLVLEVIVIVVGLKCGGCYRPCTYNPDLASLTGQNAYGSYFVIPKSFISKAPINVIITDDVGNA